MTREKNKIRQNICIYFKIIKNPDTSMRIWPKLTADIITDIGE